MCIQLGGYRNERLCCVHTVHCDVSIQSKWVTVEWKGRRTGCPHEGEGCVHTNSVE